MKKMVRFVCTFLAFVVFLAVPVSALVTSEERASNYFSTHTLYLEKTSGNGINIWFDVTGVDEMDELGASSIIMQRSVDKDTWEDMKTYTKSVYPQMIEKKTGYHSCCLKYTGSSGYYYRAYITFYAKKGTGTATYRAYTSNLKL